MRNLTSLQKRMLKAWATANPKQVKNSRTPIDNIPLELRTVIAKSINLTEIFYHNANRYLNELEL